MTSLDVKDWMAAGTTIEEARNRVSAAAIARKWFKEVDCGRALGEWLMKYAAHNQLANTIGHLNEVRDFIYAAAVSGRSGGERADASGEPGG